MAREKDRLLAAKGEKNFEAVSPESLDESSASLKKERPLAARRNKIAQAAAAVQKDKEDVDSENTPVKIEVPKKSIDEINQEIQENTKKFDADMLAKPKDEALKDEIVKKEKKVYVMPTSTMMGVVRLLLLIVFGAFIGYRSAISPGSRLEKINLLQIPSTRLKNKHEDSVQQALIDKISRTNGEESIPSAGNGESNGVGFLKWILAYLEGLLEGGFYGASIVWTVSNLLKKPLEKQFGTRSPNSSGIIALLLSIYNHGFHGIFDSFLISIAEIVFYMLIIMISGATFSHLIAMHSGEEQLESAGIGEL